MTWFSTSGSADRDYPVWLWHPGFYAEMHRSILESVQYGPCALDFSRTYLWTFYQGCQDKERKPSLWIFTVVHILNFLLPCQTLPEKLQESVVADILSCRLCSCPLCDWSYQLGPLCSRSWQVVNNLEFHSLTFTVWAKSGSECSATISYKEVHRAGGMLWLFWICFQQKTFLVGQQIDSETGETLVR